MRLISGLPRDQVSARGMLDAVAGLPWVLYERDVVPPLLERGYRRLDAMQLNSRTRSYVS
jgi:N-acetylglucosaminyl-diphospho-decaprenol L-rhamnosyltransferase